MRQFKKLELKDLEEILEWRNHPSIRKVMFQQDKIEWEEHLKWFERRACNSEIIDMIYTKSEENIGYMSFEPINNNYCEWGFYINPLTKQGAGLFLGFDAIEFCFRDLKKEGIIGNVLGSNEKSRRFHEKLGFSLDSKTKHVDGNLSSELKYTYSLLRDDWMQIRLDIKNKIHG